MNVFVIHRFQDKKKARKELSRIAKFASISINPIFLDSAAEQWRTLAAEHIRNCEAVVVFNIESCRESENADWELSIVAGAQKTLVEVDESLLNHLAADQLKAVYDFSAEFDECFPSTDKGVLDLYKIMVESSEQLIQRRLRTNAFFITAIGSMLAIAGLLTRAGAITHGSVWILYSFATVGLLLCKSWSNLIDNYGKLNTAKYDVILRLEKVLDAQIYQAEWLALGKGKRPKKYKSFTSTEKNVPLYFALLIIFLSIIFFVGTSNGNEYFEYNGFHLPF